jgi:hypothetical protein
MSWLRRRIQRQAALLAGAVLVIVNVVAGLGVLHISDSVLGWVNAALAALLAILVRLVDSAQLSRVRRAYLRRARYTPEALVPTAGSMIGEVVGRDKLCQVLIEDLRDPGTRRPHLIVGGVGTGKTALLVRLTQILAARGFVPVPIALRDIQSELDLRVLAYSRFRADAEAALLSDADVEVVWRHLGQDDKIVVLADGLEEALIEGDVEEDRHNLIAAALRRANDNRLPLIITSRAHDALRGLEATIIGLGPLNDSAALQYIQLGGQGVDEDRLDWIVETADVAEMPLYLQITRHLHQAGLIGGGMLDTRSVDRAELRLRLLETWTQALTGGYFLPWPALSRVERQATVEQLSLLACIGLKRGRLHVKFDDFDFEALHSPRPPITEEVADRLKVLRRGFDIRLAATRGMQLGLVEERGDGVRFPHSIMQAYLGSRLIHVAMADEQYRQDALKDPGRELLIALVMYSRARVREARPNGAAVVRVPVVEADPTRPLQDVLVEAAGRRDDVKTLDLYAAALEIDSIDETPTHADIAARLREHWPRISARDERTLEEAKLNLVRRFGEAARMIAERRRRNELGFTAEPAYLELYRISAAEPMYPIRLAAAQEIGAGGDEAFAALQVVLGPQDQADLEADGEWREFREKVTRAWLAPLLVGSVTSMGAWEAARRNLARWLQFITTTDQGRGESDLRLSLEVALAQGFKFAANRRRRHPHTRPHLPTTRADLVEQAEGMLVDARFWFTRLTLVQALCLWSLPDGPNGRQSGRGRGSDPEALVKSWLAVPSRGPEHPFVVEAGKLAILALETGQPERFIWMDETGIVTRVGSLTGLPEGQRKHELWLPPWTGWTGLDQRAQQLVADVLLLLNLGERGKRPADLALHAQREERTIRNDLPPCLTGDRSPLDPTRTIGMASTWEPGSNCKDGCQFKLCPYPPKGALPYHAELSEAFCRRQQALLDGNLVRRRAAPWQTAPPRVLRRFWKQMGLREADAETRLA